MYRHSTSRLRGPLSRNCSWWKVAPDPLPTNAPRLRSSTAGIRTELVARVRREIAEGRYDTPERWDAALDRLLAHMGRA